MRMNKRQWYISLLLNFTNNVEQKKSKIKEYTHYMIPFT